MISFDPYWGPVIGRKAGVQFNPDVDVVVARVRVTDEREDILGGSIFQGYTHESIGIHVASFAPNWINKDLLYTTFGYPFLQLDVKRIFGRVPADKPHVLAFDLNLGFKEIARIPKVYEGGIDDIILCMEKEECRFIRQRYSCSRSNLAA